MNAVYSTFSIFFVALLLVFAFSGNLFAGRMKRLAPKGNWKARIVGKSWIGSSSTKQLTLKIASKKGGALSMKSSLAGLRVLSVRVGSRLYKKLMIKGAAHMNRVGFPDLPVIKKMVQVPLGSRVVVRNVKSAVNVYRGYDIFPAQVPTVDMPKSQRVPFQKKAGVYSSSKWFPKSIVRVGRPAVIRGLQFVTVYQYPVQYNPKARRIRVHKNITFDLVTRGKVTSKALKKAQRRYSPAFNKILGHTALNFTMPPASMFVIDKRVSPDLINSLKGCDYLIIAKDSFCNALAPLVEHKTAKGLIVKIVKLSSIGSSPSAADIKNCIKSWYLYKTPAPTYVLLVGDANIIRPFYVHNHPHYSEGYRKVGTDLYYGCVDGSDSLPDIFVGRLPAKTSNDVTQMVSKIIAFENGISNDAIWSRRQLMAAYFQDNDPKDGTADRCYLQTIESIRKYLKNKKNEAGRPFSLYTVYTQTSGSPSPKKYRDGTAVAGVGFNAHPTSDLISRINNGVGFLYHRDHGSKSGLSSPSFKVGNLAMLHNNKPFVGFTINCRTGLFDSETGPGLGGSTSDCLAEALLRKQAPAGAASVIGATRNSPTFRNDDLIKGLVEAVYPGFLARSSANPQHSPVYTLGQAFNFARNYMRIMNGDLDSVYTLIEYEIYNLLGDPDLQIRYRKPKFLYPQAVLYRPWLTRKFKPKATGIMRKTYSKPVKFHTRGAYRMKQHTPK